MFEPFCRTQHLLQDSSSTFHPILRFCRLAGLGKLPEIGSQTCLTIRPSCGLAGIGNFPKMARMLIAEVCTGRKLDKVLDLAILRSRDIARVGTFQTHFSDLYRPPENRLQHWFVNIAVIWPCGDWHLPQALLNRCSAATMPCPFWELNDDATPAPPPGFWGFAWHVEICSMFAILAPYFQILRAGDCRDRNFATTW